MIEADKLKDIKDIEFDLSSNKIKYKYPYKEILIPYTILVIIGLYKNKIITNLKYKGLLKALFITKKGTFLGSGFSISYNNEKLDGKRTYYDSICDTWYEKPYYSFSEVVENWYKYLMDWRGEKDYIIYYKDLLDALTIIFRNYSIKDVKNYIEFDFDYIEFISFPLTENEKREKIINEGGCEVCGGSNASYIADPYYEEMYGEKRMTYMCSDCYYNSCMDV